MASPHLHGFPDSLRFARDLARSVGVPLSRTGVHTFPDGESLVRVKHPAGCEAIVVRSLHDPNAKLLEVLLAADALRRAGAQRVTLVAPYLPYMRQDRVFAPGQPLSQRVVGALLGGMFERVLTIEAHLHRVRRLDEVVPCAARSLSAAPALAAWIGSRKRTLVVGPDVESAPWVRAIARRAGLPWIVGEKARLGDRRVRIRLPPLPPTQRAVIVDDIASSGATLVAAARALRRAGVPVIDVVAVHAIFAPGALARIRRAGVRRVVSCDTIPHVTNRIRLAPVMAAALAAR
jgi:ribose-phosphate pyrophosphokinase